MVGERTLHFDRTADIAPEALGQAFGCVTFSQNLFLGFFDDAMDIISSNSDGERA